MNECMELLSIFRGDPMCEVFQQPVDWQGLGLFDYPEIVAEPMDFQTIKDKLDDDKYSTMNSFAYDMRLVFKNCMKYNRPDSELYKLSEKLHKKFEKNFSTLVKKYNIDTSLSDNNNTSSYGKAARHKFGQNIHKLKNSELGQIVDTILRSSPEAINDDEENLEIELNNIDNDTFLKLQDLMNGFLSNLK